MTSAPKVGIVGYGYAGKTFHAPLIAGVPGLQWVGVSSSDAARVHADWPGLDVHDPPEAPIARPDNDLIVIVIATPKPRTSQLRKPPCRPASTSSSTSRSR